MAAHVAAEDTMMTMTWASASLHSEIRKMYSGNSLVGPFLRISSLVIKTLKNVIFAIVLQCGFCLQIYTIIPRTETVPGGTVIPIHTTMHCIHSWWIRSVLVSVEVWWTIYFRVGPAVVSHRSVRSIVRLRMELPPMLMLRGRQRQLDLSMGRKSPQKSKFLTIYWTI